MTHAESIFKILRPAEWLAFSAARRFEGSTDDLRDGFIHFSTSTQVPGTLERHFDSETEVVILRVEAALLGDALRWEPSRRGDLFPHLYRPLQIEEIADTTRLLRTQNGFDLGASGLGESCLERCNLSNAASTSPGNASPKVC